MTRWRSSTPSCPGSWIIPLAGPANRQARVAAESICGRDTEYESTQGTSIVKVFDMVAGGTGATEKQLKAAGIPFLRAHAHPSGHAGYYPGTAQMDIKCLFSPEDGRVLGAQITGFDGVDKRLDVFATAIRLGATVYDLEKLELAYAPPFGSAKDPVNMIGFVASNILRGDLVPWYSTDYPENCQGARIIDVRGPSEFDIWHVPGAENVPLNTLRTAHVDWDRDVPIRLYCAVGFRSFLAYRILAQRGFTDVKMLVGGIQTFRAWHTVAPEDVPDPVVPVTSYAEEESLRAGGVLPAAPLVSTGVEVDLDCTGLACPGPIMALQKKMGELNPGDEVIAHVSDIGFRLDAPAWAAKNGHEVLDIKPEGPGVVARIRKGGAVVGVGGATMNPVAARLKDKKSFVVFSGDFDKVLAAFIIANGAVAMGDEVSMFFTFWGLNALRRPDAPGRGQVTDGQGLRQDDASRPERDEAVPDAHARRWHGDDQEDHEGQQGPQPARADPVGSGLRRPTGRVHHDDGPARPARGRADRRRRVRRRGDVPRRGQRVQREVLHLIGGRH